MIAAPTSGQECDDVGVEYRLVDLGDPGVCSAGETTRVFAYGLNEQGEIVGEIRCFFGPILMSVLPFVWLPEEAYGTPMDPMEALEFHILHGGCGGAREINDNGVVAGFTGDCFSPPYPGGTLGAIWELAGDQLVQVLSVGEDDTYVTFSVNDATPFQCVGEYGIPSGPGFTIRGFLGTEGTSGIITSAISPVGQWATDGGLAINNDSMNPIVGGWSGACSQETGEGGTPEGGCPLCPTAQGDASGWLVRGRSVVAGQALFQPDDFLEPQPPDDVELDEVAGASRGVNESTETDPAELCGWGAECLGNPYRKRALFWEDKDDDEPVNLHLDISTIDQTQANALNNDDDPIVVGQITNQDEALIWRRESGDWCYRELEDLIDSLLLWDLENATDINDSGWITGWGLDASNNTRAFLLIPLASPGCPADTNGDCMVDVQDLVNVILAWGTFCIDCMGDATGDTTVNVEDLVAVITAWGPCACGTGTPLSLSQALANAGLDESDWAQLLANIEDENHRCWMAYHLGGSPGTCPGADPY